jgi:hypothetical protein
LSHRKETVVHKLFLTLEVSVFCLTACNGWIVQPLPYNPPPTPFPTGTPIIYTATPLILPLPMTATSTGTPPSTTTSSLPSTTSTDVRNSATPALTYVTDVPPNANIHANVLGCEDGFDITHGMGKVTNSYVTIGNVGITDIPNVCATLRGLNEGRPHPDKTKCITSIPAGYQVTLKLTIDTTFKKDTPIQIDVTSNNNLLKRIGQVSCTDISLFPPSVESLGKVIPIP